MTNWKRTGNPDTDNRNIQPRFCNKIWHWKMCNVDNGKWEKRNDRRNKTTKSRKRQNARREGKLQVLENIGSGNKDW